MNWLRVNDHRWTGADGNSNTAELGLIAGLWTVAVNGKQVGSAAQLADAQRLAQFRIRPRP